MEATRDGTEAGAGRRAPLPAPLAALAGLLMGAADAVPGVSGGTIALVVGVYERLVEALAALLGLRPRPSEAQRRRIREALRFLLPLLVGLGAAWFVATRLLVGPTGRPGLLLRPETAPLCYGFFFGLVLVSLREPWRRIRAVAPGHVAGLLAGAALAFLVTGLPHARGTPPTWALLYGGALAVCVMLLPGISGSLLLLVLGQYHRVTRAVHDFDALPLLALLTGIVAGLLAFVRPLRYLLRRHHDATMAVLTGLMLGSLRALWPWKSHYDPRAGAFQNEAPGALLPAVVGALLLGGLAAWGLARLERRMRGGPGPAPEATLSPPRG